MEDLVSSLRNILQKAGYEETEEDKRAWELSDAAAEAKKKFERGEITREEKNEAFKNSSKAHLDALFSGLSDDKGDEKRKDDKDDEKREDEKREEIPSIFDGIDAESLGKLASTFIESMTSLGELFTPKKNAKSETEVETGTEVEVEVETEGESDSESEETNTETKTNAD